MGLIYREYLRGSRVLACCSCKTHLSTRDEIISKSFHGQHGQAYLFKHVVNVLEGLPEDRNMLTGLHTVCDISCVSCETILGWKYLRAFEESQKYKEGMFILERPLFTTISTASSDD
ncbi:yippee-like protein [Conidiobolus coronatus NRRL 28638]|uniref:Protein yippee-like n=1 Tax=Conidiobolus coronatus (strain ATCC 28846 / CBS 209.66 / NRRL 28638) TaxID=796925 RepID=A0A137P869_CONC2|nr:yippee-like protein [Conidiobolus coronatus NRRL 28638]|eukprot:KXN71207.1 yippee-like protein [Conidiobolus coronatus NRRL 28638]